VDHIQLEGMSFKGRHGVRDAERANAQEFLVDIEVDCDLADAGRSDKLADTVDYTRIRAIAKAVIEGEPAQLIESLASRMADQVLQLPRVEAITVRIAKRPASMQPIDSAAVRIYRTRA